MILALLLTGMLGIAACRAEPAGAADAVAAADAVGGPGGDAEAAAADPTAPEPQESDAAADQDGEAGEEPTSDDDADTDDEAAPAAPEDGSEGAPADVADGASAADGSPYQVVEPLVEEPRTTFDAAEQVLAEGEDYLARIVTSEGTMVVELYEDRVPSTVNNFVFLALNRFYEGVPFHRVLEDFMAQTGDPTGTGRGGPGYQFADEIDPELTHDAAGVLSMANAGPNTNGSQFFITFTATPWLDGNHAVFGRVVEGMEVLDRLTRVSPDEPTAVAMLEDSVESVVAQGVALTGPGDRTIGEHLDASLGTTPVAGQSFTVDGYRGVIGRVDDQPAVGFFAQPDVIERVEVLTRTEPAAQEQTE